MKKIRLEIPLRLIAVICLIGAFVTMAYGVMSFMNSITITLTDRKIEDSNKSSYVIVSAKGVLHYGVISVGGETTGVIVVVDKDNWDLDFGSNKELFRLAEKLDGKKVLVTGEPKISKGTTIPVRKVILVSDLKKAE